jgi:hypothetical protein
MGEQRSPTIQNNTPAPIVGPPGHNSIAFRQSVKDVDFSSTASLDPGQNIHIHQQVASLNPTPENGQIGGLAFSNIDIIPNRTAQNALNPHATDPTCGTATVFCTTLDQQVRVQENGVDVFVQDADFTTGVAITLVQGP